MWLTHGNWNSEYNFLDTFRSSNELFCRLSFCLFLWSLDDFLVFVLVEVINITVHTKLFAIIWLVGVLARCCIACTFSARNMIAVIAHALGIMHCSCMWTVCYLFSGTPRFIASNFILFRFLFLLTFLCINSFLLWSLLFI